MISPECTFTQRPLRMSISAAARPMATSTSSGATSDHGLRGIDQTPRAVRHGTARPQPRQAPASGDSSPALALVLRHALAGFSAMETLSAPLFWTLVLYSLSFPVLCFV